MADTLTRLIEQTDAERVQNPLERRARLAVQTMDAVARRAADAIDAPPPDSMEPTPAQARQAWEWSPRPDPATAYWQRHDAVLADAMQRIDPNDPEQRQAAALEAERTALQEVYPYRALLVGLGSADLERQMARAKRLASLAQKEERQP